VDALAPFSTRPDVKYTVRLLDTDDVNALSLPGGFVFVTRGLVQASADPESTFLVAQSDAELAGVLAHEMAHNELYHGLRSAERSGDLLKGGLAAALLTVLLGATVPQALQVLGVGMTFQQGILNHYSIEYEGEADRTAVECLIKSSYDPSGLATFMERLAAVERSRPYQDIGLYQTHPFPAERVQSIKRLIHSHGREVNPRAVTHWSRAEVLDAMVHGKPGAVVTLWDRTVYSFLGPAPTGETAAQRAQAAADTLNVVLAKGLQLYDIRVEEDAAGPWVSVMGERLVTVVADDVEAPATAAQVAEKSASELRAALFGDTLGHSLRLGK
jgi:predicted Zn-dependent protease